MIYVIDRIPEIRRIRDGQKHYLKITFFLSLSRGVTGGSKPPARSSGVSSP